MLRIAFLLLIACAMGQLDEINRLIRENEAKLKALENLQVYAAEKGKKAINNADVESVVKSA